MNLNDILNNPSEVENFKMFLNENMAAQDLMCWIDIEAFRGIPSMEHNLRDLKARELRLRYFTKKYLLGPNSPASKEAQRQMISAGGTHHRLPARPNTAVFIEAQKHIRARLEKKWMMMFIKTPEYLARNGMKIEEEEEGRGVNMDGGNSTALEQKFTHSHGALLLRKALQDASSRHLFLLFLSLRAVSGTHPQQDVEFWLEVQRFKWMCHAHSDQQSLRDKLKAMRECYFVSSIPPRLQVDVPQHIVNQLTKKSVGPYIFREAQTAVFKHLYSYWQEYQNVTHSLSNDEIAAEIGKMERRKKQIQQNAEERERRLQSEFERYKKSIPRFETTQEREERLQKEKECEQFSEVSIAFSLTRPHPDYTCLSHTDINVTQKEENSSSTVEEDKERDANEGKDGGRGGGREGGKAGEQNGDKEKQKDGRKSQERGMLKNREKVGDKEKGSNTSATTHKNAVESTPKSSDHKQKRRIFVVKGTVQTAPQKEKQQSTGPLGGRET